ncbi:MAG TPA: hypothetical protein VND22_07665 [Actinomycetota bacterium]|nr:hypothetical protein [Actinomycetota bacterium]
MKHRIGLCVIFVALAMTTACSYSAGGRPLDPPRNPKVLIFGIPAVTWEDLGRASVPTFDKLARQGATGNASVRVLNIPGEGYATLGMGQRVQVDHSAGLAFDVAELVENGTGADLFERRSSFKARGAVVVVPIDQISKRNVGRAFDARPGYLASNMEKRGMTTAVIGNADTSLAPLPSRLPPLPDFFPADARDSGIHREAALVVMRQDGTVASGTVSRALLRADASAPYGISTSLDALSRAFDESWPKSTLVVVENGDTSRAESYANGLPKESRESARAAGLERADSQLELILRKVDLSKTLVIVVAPTTPGGGEERGQLRPVILAGAGVGAGTLQSASTRRDGLIAMHDITASIAKYLDLADERFAAGRALKVIPRASSSSLTDTNSRAVTHDQLRPFISLIALSAMFVLSLLALIRLKNGPLDSKFRIMLLSSLAFPLASYVSTAGVWKAGRGLAAATIIVASVALGFLAHVTFTRNRTAVLAITLATSAYFFLDLALGAPGQLDSVFGYSSIAGGRFYGLGNLGFALFASAVFLAAGSLIDSRDRWSRVVVALLLVAAIIGVGHPRLGDDVGGTITMIPAAAVFLVNALREKRLRTRWLPLLVLAGVGMVLVFGAIDLMRPPETRTHLGDFLAGSIRDPLTVWLVLQRKLETGVRIAISNYWGLAVPGAAIAIVQLHRRSPYRLRELMRNNPALTAGLDALLLAAVLGSLVNDSGLAVAGLMLAVLVPWIILVASELQEEVASA